MRRIGIGYRGPLAKWVHSYPPDINCLELVAEHFFDDPSPIEKLRHHYPLMLHSLGISLGTPGPLDTGYLKKFVEICQIADPLWVSEHIAFTRTRDIDLGHLNPIPYTHDTLAYFIDHVLELQAACHKPLLLENITSHLRIDSPMQETDFINSICYKTGCSMLLDVTNLFVNSRNHQFDPCHWLRQIEPHTIRQIHIVGYSEHAGMLHDSHDGDIQQELYELTREAIHYSGVDTIIIERDHNFPSIDKYTAELQTLARCFPDPDNTYLAGGVRHSG